MFDSHDVRIQYHWSVTVFPHRSEDPPIKTAVSQSSDPQYHQETRSGASPSTDNYKLDLQTLCHYAFCQYEHTLWLYKEISSNNLPTHLWSRCIIDYQCARNLSFSRGLVVLLLGLEDNRLQSKILIQLLWFTLIEKVEPKEKLEPSLCKPRGNVAHMFISVRITGRAYSNWTEKKETCTLFSCPQYF